MTPIKTKPLLFPKIIRYTAIIAVLAVGAWYVIFQARFLITGPQVRLMEEPSITQSGRTVEIKGVAENVTALFINGRAIVTDREGAFKENLVLENGYTIMSIDARDRYGRTVHLERPYVYTPLESTENASSQEEEKLKPV